MKNIELLDCTLRDGGRLFNCEFSDEMISDVSKRLESSHVDIIEIGFLRDKKTVIYNGNSTFFTDVNQIKQFIPGKKQRKAMFVAFVDYGMFDISSLKPYDGESIDGIRFGFTHKNLFDNKFDVIKCMNDIKDKGYKLFVQNVNTPGYTDIELLRLIKNINNIKPYSYGIVDTYGAMYEEDLGHYFYMINHNLNSDIKIDFHSHNNYQMSFALAQKIIKLSEVNGRQIIIDATLNGMGKGAGNLNLELLIDYLIRIKNYNYDMDAILDIIDDYLNEIKKNNTWGYSIPGLFSGIYKCHPNNMIYLTEKFDLALKDIKTILSSVSPEKRERYDYDNLQKVCSEYRHTKIDDNMAINMLKESLGGKDILLIMPGSSIDKFSEEISRYYFDNKPMVISVNFVYCGIGFESDMVFFGSSDRYRKYRKKVESNKKIVTSNIKADKSDILVNYESLVERGNIYFDNSSIMCLNLLKKVEVKSIKLAGFDGYSDSHDNYNKNNELRTDLILGKSVQLNTDIQDMFSRFCKSVLDSISISFITPSIYEIPGKVTKL